MLDGIDPYQFEHLVESLYHRMGFYTRMTTKTKDGGRDIIVIYDRVGHSEVTIIQCKHSKNKCPVDTVKSLRGTVHDYKATKGTLVCTGGFTDGEASAIEYAERNPSIELIDRMGVERSMNERFGTDWPKHIDHYVTGSIK